MGECLGIAGIKYPALVLMQIAAVWGVGFSAMAQTYPAKAVRVIVPFAPGGGSDITARQFAARLSESFGQQFVVDNRGGGGGVIGMEMTAKAVPDGYTIMMMSGSFSVTAATHKPAFDPINNIVPVAEFGITPFVLAVHPSLAVRSTAELIALARTRPDQLAYASSGLGGMSHLATELMLNMSKTKMIHVPYKSAGPAMTDLLAGQTPIIVSSLTSIVPFLDSGRLRPLAVTTAKRWYSLPDIPTVAETLPGYEVVLWFGTMAPRGVPAKIIAQLNAAVNKSLSLPDMKRNLEAQGMTATGGTPEQFNDRIRREYGRWVQIIREANIKIE